MFKKIIKCIVVCTVEYTDHTQYKIFQHGHYYGWFYSQLEIVDKLTL